MKVNINSLDKLPNPESYPHLLESLSKNRTLLENHLAKYTENEDYDIILNEYVTSKKMVEEFNRFTLNNELIMNDILDAIKKHQELFIKNSNISSISKLLNLEEEEKKDTKIKSINEIYAKIQENSDLIILYDIEKKKFYHNKIPEFNNLDIKRFEAKSYSYFRDNTIYVSGGFNVKSKQYFNDFYKISVRVNFDKFEFNFESLTPMINERASHTQILFKNKFLITIGGINTKSCEVFDLDVNKWFSLPDLPSLCPNSSLTIVEDKYLYIFIGSVNLSSIDTIYRIKLNNLEKILNNERGFENLLEFEEIPFYFSKKKNNEENDSEEINNESELQYNRNSFRLRRGMASAYFEGTILLFGGFDYDNNHDEIYEFIGFEKKVAKKGINSNNSNNKEFENNLVEVENEEKEIATCNYSLPIKTFFNSNIVQYEYFLIMIDGQNNCIEYDIKSKEFYYYT